MDYDKACRRCPRLAGYLDDVRERYPDYHAAPVAAFGSRHSRLLIVGLAPGLHGANRTGRPFTGDASGAMLFRALAAWSFANKAESTAPRDGLKLSECRITNAVKCVPPGNRPTPAEVAQCNTYLRSELDGVWRPRVRRSRCVLTLGGVAHRAVSKALDLKPKQVPFIHGRHTEVAPGLHVLSSYHPSRLNVSTKRIDYAMLHEIIGQAARLLDG